ncbi:MAG: hypothetical protein K5633_01395 [Paludibacteraceae bacterium]|nr:hypothetical protein [Paludibacteraceae bacterium]
MKSDQFEIKEARSIPYAIHSSHKRTLRQRLVKIKNTILLLLAYVTPNNYCRVKFNQWRGVHIGKHVYIGLFCFLDNLHPEYIYIEDDVSVNAESMVLTHFNPRGEFRGVFLARVRPVLIKRGAVVSVRSTVMPGIEIGEWSCVSAGTIVDKDVPAYTVVSGNPMQIGNSYQALFERAQKRNKKA